jgi:cation transport ATPase
VVMTSVAARRVLLPVVASSLVTGTVAAALGYSEAARAVWQAATVIVAGDLALLTAARLKKGRIAVDVVALLALIGSLALGEALAGVIIALMVASGDALEQYAHHRAQRDLAQRDLAQLLSLAPKIAHRLTDERMNDVGADAVQVGDVLLVKPGEVVPVDGATFEPAVLDESVLTGETAPSSSRPVGRCAAGPSTWAARSECGQPPRPRTAPMPESSVWCAPRVSSGHRSCGSPTGTPSCSSPLY